MSRTTVVADEVGFTIRVAQSRLDDWLGQTPKRARVDWSSVLEAIAAKADQLTVDTIFVEFRLLDGRRVVVTEDDVGWKEFLEAAARFLPGFPTGDKWLWDVAQPPFAPNIRSDFVRQLTEQG